VNILTNYKTLYISIGFILFKYSYRVDRGQTSPVLAPDRASAYRASAWEERGQGPELN
jgi:hypothetical protein